MASTKLQMWNRALRLLALPRLSTINDNMPTLFELEDAWPIAVDEALDAGLWNFATETATLTTADAAVIPGYAYKQARPADFLRVVKISNASDFSTDADYRLEGTTYLHTQDATVYLRYVSNELDDDADVASWPASFIAAVVARLAIEVAPILRPGDARVLALAEAKWRSALIDAQQKNDMDRHPQHRIPETILASAVLNGALNGN